MEDLRAAAKEAVLQLGHEPVMAEDFGARANSPQVVCLEGLRQSGLVILILGSSYGAKQPSALSATHEEYREAKLKHPVLAFVQEGVNHDSDQINFIKEVQGWIGGLFRGGFDTSDKLRQIITRAIHEWQMSTAVSPLNTEELTNLAINAVAEELSGRTRNPALILSVIGGPIQSILRPSEIEKPQLADDILKEALFGEHKIFSTQVGTKSSIESDSLIIWQEERSNLIKLDPQGGMLFRLALPQSRTNIVIKEHLEQQIVSAISYVARILDKIDPTQRLTHISMAVAFSDANYAVIRTQAENDANPNSFNMGFSYGGQRKNPPLTLKPSYRPRAALQFEARNLAEDFVTLLKRSGSEGKY